MDNAIAANKSSEEELLTGMKSVAEAECYLEFLLEPYPIRAVSCNATWDGLSCWPTTAAGILAEIPCFAQLNGVQYDTSSNASRFCHQNGSWSPWSNYRSCKPLSLLQDDELLQGLWDTKEAATIYYVGYGVSLVALSLALLVFARFKDLRCLRNTIHTNLMVTYFLIDLTWILTATLQSSPDPAAAKVGCFLVILLTYLMATNFFWMLVEGLYLYMMVVKTFDTDNVSIKIYLLIGWGIPAFVAAAWALAKGFAGGVTDEPFAQRGCPWQNKDYYDYVFSCPVMVVLLVNIFFLSRIMWVLITKLRAANSQESKQYWKAAKALLVLIPLLGVTYIIVIATPSDPVAEVVFIYIQATLLSIQGFIVAVLYCFLNGEVQGSLRSHLQRWRTKKSVERTARQSTRHHSSNRSATSGHQNTGGTVVVEDGAQCAVRRDSDARRSVRGHML